MGVRSYVFHDEYYFDLDGFATFISWLVQVRVPLNTARAYYHYRKVLSSLLTFTCGSLGGSEHGSVRCSIEDTRNRVHGTWGQLSDDVQRSAFLWTMNLT